MEEVLKLLKSMQDDMAKNTKTMKDDKEQMLAEMKAYQGALARMDANMGSMRAELKSAIEDMTFNGEETMACQEKTEARLQGEPASEDMTPEVAQEQDVSLEDAVEMPVGEPRKRLRDRQHLAAVRRQKEEERHLDARRRRKQRNFVAVRRGTTRCAGMARRKENLIGEKIGPGTWYEEPQNDGLSGRNVSRHRKKTKMD
jgi:hypothetical protein